MRVISYYPLTSGFRSVLEAEAGRPLEFATVGHLRSLKATSAMRAVRALRSDHLVIAIENESARPLATPLSLIGVLSGSKAITLVVA